MIELYHVHKSYGRDADALIDVTLRIQKGEFVFLTGPSGAGKTTLLKLLFCAERASRGQVLVAGKNVARLRQSAIPHLRRNIGVVFQDFKLIADRTAFENVACALEVLGVPIPEVRKRTFLALKRVGLAHKQNIFPPRLSGGEQQRTAIARALVADPLILLADEPTGNLDPERTDEIMRLLEETNARGTTVLVATHDPGLLERFPKRVIRLDAGRVAPGSAGLASYG